MCKDIYHTPVGCDPPVPLLFSAWGHVSPSPPFPCTLRHWRSGDTKHKRHCAQRHCAQNSAHQDIAAVTSAHNVIVPNDIILFNI